MSESPRSPGGDWSPARQWPLALVLTCLLASCVVVGTGHWRRGAFAIGLSVGLAGLLRLALPSRLAGLLAVRSRWWDTVLLLGAAVALVMLTLVVPPSAPRSS